MEKEKRRDKEKKIIFTLFLTALLFVVSCTNYKYKVVPNKKEKYDYLKIKINYTDKANNYKGRLLILKKGEDKKVYLLDPLGRLHFKLIINGEKTTAIYVKKKKYWQGNFINFIWKIWRMNLNFEKFYKAVFYGIIPDTIKTNYIIKMIRNHKGKPKIIEIKDENLILKIKILKRIEKSGIIDFKTNLTKYKRVILDELFKK